MANMQEMMNAILHLSGQITEFNQTLRNQISDVQLTLTNQISGVEQKLTAVEQEVKGLSDNFNDWKGQSNERLLREEVKRKYGEFFCRKFVVQGLSGLARLIVPPKRDTVPTYLPRDPEKHDFDDNLSDCQLQQRAVDKLKDYIFQRRAYVTALRLIIKSIDSTLDVEELLKSIEAKDFIGVQKNPTGKETEEINRRKKLRNYYDLTVFPKIREKGKEPSPLLEAFIAWTLKDKAEQIKDLLSDNGVGLMMFCSAFDQLNGDFPVVDIEFDCRGVIHEMADLSMANNTANAQIDRRRIVVTAGEIKSSFEGVPKAKLQLRKRLIILKESIEITKCREGAIDLRGIIFLPIEASKTRKSSQSLPSSNEYSLALEFL